MRFVSGETDKYLYFVGVDATDFATRETGLSSFTVYRSRNGAAAAAMTTPTINEVDSTNMPGVYELLLDEDMTIGSGNDSEEMVFHITHAGMAPVTRTIELYRPKITAGETLTVSGGEGEALLAAAQSNKITFANGIVVNVTDSNTPALDLNGNGTGAGIDAQGGTGGAGILATGGAGADGMDLQSGSGVASKGLNIQSNASSGAGDGVRIIPAGAGSSIHLNSGEILGDLNGNVTGSVASVTAGVSLAAGAVTNASLAGNMEIVFETDFATNYNATRNAWATNVQDIVGTGSLGLNNLSAADVNAECDTALADYDGPTKAEMDAGFGALNDPAAATIADAVLDEALSGHTTAGTLGKAVADIEADTNELQSDDIPGTLTTIEGKIDTVDTVVDGIQTDLSNGTDGLGALKTLIDTIQTEVEKMTTTAHSEPTSVPAANEAPIDKIGYLFMALRNQVDVTATKKTFYGDGGVAVWKKDLSDDGTTYTETEANAI